MRNFPQSFIALGGHLLTLILMVIIVCGPQAFVTDEKTGPFFREWPDLWRFLPTMALVVNVFLIICERSIMGLITVAACGLWIWVSYQTLPMVFDWLAG